MIRFKSTCAVLITKESVYPKAVLDDVARFSFGEIKIVTHCGGGPWLRYHEAMTADVPFVYVQDDDAICPVEELMKAADPAYITCAMKPRYLDTYKDLRCALVGWGAVFPLELLQVFNEYFSHYPSDDFFCREADRIFTGLNYDRQRRLSLPISDLPSAMSGDRLSMHPKHYSYRDEALRRVERLIACRSK